MRCCLVCGTVRSTQSCIALWQSKSRVDGYIERSKLPSRHPTGVDYGVNGGYFVIGQDFEVYTAKNNSQLLQGVSSLGSDLYFSANMGAMAAGAVMDYWCHYDFKLIIRDGI